MRVVGKQKWLTVESIFILCCVYPEGEHVYYCMGARDINKVTHMSDEEPKSMIEHGCRRCLLRWRIKQRDHDDG
jgi:hypothetical protein